MGLTADWTQLKKELALILIENVDTKVWRDHGMENDGGWAEIYKRHINCSEKYKLLIMI